MPSWFHSRSVCLACLGAATGVLAGAGSDAAAGDLGWDDAKLYGAVSVRDRSRDAWRPDGIKVGNFLLLPHVGYGIAVADHRSSGGAGGAGTRVRDLRHLLATGFDLAWQTGRHFVGIKAEGRAIQLKEEGSDELRYLDGSIESTFRFDIDHATAIIGNASIGLGHDPNVDAEKPDAASRPPEVARTSAEIALQRRQGRIDATVGTRYLRLEFSDATANDGSHIDLRWQDYEIVSPFVHLGWNASPGYRVFGGVNGRLQQNRGNAIVDRDARGIEARLGVELEVSPLVRIGLSGGWLQQDYLQAGLIDVSEPVWDAWAQWMATPLLTLSLSTSRDVRPTTHGHASGQLMTSYALKADYEVWRNLIVTAEGSLRQSTYFGSEREDTVWSGIVSAEYMHTKNWLLTLSYEHQQLFSNVTLGDRSLDRIGVAVKYRY